MSEGLSFPIPEVTELVFFVFLAYKVALAKQRNEGEQMNAYN